MEGFNLTRGQAVAIKNLRRKGYTWRAIARDVGLRWPHLGVHIYDCSKHIPALAGAPLRERISGNQLDGEQLCTDAERVLGLPHGAFDAEDEE